ncbi:hypothetical protein [Rhodovulum sulfidophilum]|uniref:hypothetical protein n=1 Tax=Rhodovulum sulfidophilum TaxID=35806 RepID=UPI001389E096|nr:hypothetical protein [Rhodovulum sulfidophilum]NDK37046.1 hypothetical protein [Rhodovulum sulfidophilum]
MQTRYFFRLVFTFGVAVALPAVAEEKFWTIAEDRAACIRDNASQYAEHGSDPIVIVVQGCPEVDVMAALASSAKNMAPVGVMRGDSVLIFTRSELACLKELQLEVDDDGFVRIPKSLTCE